MSALTTSNPDNANPTVHKTGHEASSRSRYRLADFLDEQDGDDRSEDGFEGSSSSTVDGDKTTDTDSRMHEDGLTFEGETGSESEHEEPIDSQEIFGGQTTHWIYRGL